MLLKSNFDRIIGRFIAGRSMTTLLLLNIFHIMNHSKGKIFFNNFIKVDLAKAYDKLCV